MAKVHYAPGVQNGKARINLLIEPDHFDRIAELARASNTSLSAVARQAIISFLDKANGR